MPDLYFKCQKMDIEIVQMQTDNNITVLLQAWKNGQEQALEELTPLIYKALKDIADRLCSKESRGSTMQATEIVHEAFVRLYNNQIDWQDRAHFYAVAARTMRRLLVDIARAKRSHKREGGLFKVTLHESLHDEGMVNNNKPEDMLLDFEDALAKLTNIDERKSDVLTLHIYGGLTAKEASEVLNISTATVERDLAFAKAFVNRELKVSIN